MLEFYIRSLAGIAFLLGLIVISALTSLSRSVTCTLLSSPFFYSRDVFGIGFSSGRWSSSEGQPGPTPAWDSRGQTNKHCEGRRTRRNDFESHEEGIGEPSPWWGNWSKATGSRSEQPYFSLMGWPPPLLSVSRGWSRVARPLFFLCVGVREKRVWSTYVKNYDYD